MLETYCRIFNLNWKNRIDDLLAYSPIDLKGTIRKESIQDVIAQVKQASMPYIPNIIKQVKQL